MYTQVKGYRVRTPSGQDHGKLHDLYVDLDTWNVPFLVVSGGILMKKETYPFTMLTDVDEIEKMILLEDSDPLEEVPAGRALARMKDLLGTKVMSEEGEDVGKLYDIDISTKLKQWKVWKLLIRTGFGERRLRISSSEVRDISDRIVISALSGSSSADSEVNRDTPDRPQ